MGVNGDVPKSKEGDGESRRQSISVLAGLGIATAGLVYVPAAQAAPQGCDSRTNNSVRKLLECMRVEGVREHQQALQEIADANGGTRASGTPGYDASVEYVGGC